MKTVRNLFNWPGIGNQLNTVFHHCCLAWTLVEDDTEPIQQRQQLSTLLWLKVVQLQTSKLVFSKPLQRSTTPRHSNGQHYPILYPVRDTRAVCHCLIGWFYIVMNIHEE